MTTPPSLPHHRRALVDVVYGGADDVDPTIPDHPMIVWLADTIAALTAIDKAGTPAPWDYDGALGATWLVRAGADARRSFADHVIGRLFGTRARARADGRTAVVARNLLPNLTVTLRELLREHRPGRRYVYRDGVAACAACGDGTVEHPCLTLHLAAFALAGWQPGYRPEWRPATLPAPTAAAS